ncbi:hypothetical protein ABPG72_003240 [Tetrahymena utriculariae]
MALFQEWVYGSANDFFSWKIYDMLPKSGNVDILGLTNQFRPKFYSAWHLNPRGVNFHTRRYILKRGILENDLDVVKDALDHGLDINSEIDLKYGFTPLSLAAILNRTAIIQYLFLRGADVNKFDRTGNTPLMQAVKNWNFESIKILVESCYSDLNAKDQYGQTAQDKANFKKLKAIEVYLQDKQQINEENEKIYRKAFNLENQEQNDPSNQNPKGKKSSNISKITAKEQAQLEKQIQFKQFPKFSLELGIENLFNDRSGEQLIKNKKVYIPQALRYPFNNFKGVYRISFQNLKTVDEALLEINRN